MFVCTHLQGYFYLTSMKLTPGHQSHVKTNVAWVSKNHCRKYTVILFYKEEAHDSFMIDPYLPPATSLFLTWWMVPWWGEGEMDFLSDGIK